MYNKSSISSESDLHYLKIQTDDKNFTAHIYFAEEFVYVENSLITPAQAKIIIEVSNFTYINASSQLALYTRLDPEIDYQLLEDTEDEKNGYAIKEEGIISIAENNGFFTWKENVIIDSVSEDMLTGEPMPDDYVENAQKIYLNYPRGVQIHHDLKFGIEGILIKEPVDPIIFIILIVVIGAVSIITTYSVYYNKQHKIPTKNNKRVREEDFIKASKERINKYEDLFDAKTALQILEGDNAIEKLYLKGNIKITAISDDFYEIVDQFNLERSERSIFIQEMLSLPPHERELILRDMLIKSQ